MQNYKHNLSNKYKNSFKAAALTTKGDNVMLKMLLISEHNFLRFI